MKRKRFPIGGIFRAQGGICSAYYLTREDERRYRFLRPAEHTQPQNCIADCWIVDRRGSVNPGTNVSPVPFCLEAIGRRVKGGGA